MSDTSVSSVDVAVVIPHFQRRPGLLGAAVRSAFAQTVAGRLVVIVCDDESPSSAADELAAIPGLPHERIIVIRQSNGGAGAARNTALNAVPEGVRYVAFLDSDDVWRPGHIENAIRALECGYDVYFSNFIGVGYPDIGHFERIGSLRPQDHTLIDAPGQIHALACTALEHTVSDGGGLIGTPTVVYRWEKFKSLRFREEFYNGQDFFFWMDLSELGARYAFSFQIQCDNGEGVNIYQAAGWGSEKSLQRLRNELFVWTSVNRFYALSPGLKVANWRTIRQLQENVGLDLLHRLRHRKPISTKHVREILQMAPSTAWVAPLGVVRAIIGRIHGKRHAR